MSTLPKQTDILIVGAGPTGLAAALSLHKQGCRDLVIVDSASAGENTSRSLVVHAATLDALDEIGCAACLVSSGLKATGGKIWDGYNFHEVADFSVLAKHTKFPFMLMVPQNLTERVLGDRLGEEGVAIHRPFKVVDVKVNETNSEYSDVIFDDGQIVMAKYVIGADGSHSMVREAAGIPFTDPDGDNGTKLGHQLCVVADVTFATPPPTGSTETIFILSNGNILLLLPLPPSAYNGEIVWRMIVGMATGDPPRSPPQDYLQSLVDAYGPSMIPAAALGNMEPLRIEKTVWSSRFRTNTALAATHFTRMAGASGEGGVVMIIGDAAHKHPPAGGQGMNLGLRDAITLGPVLTAHLRASAQAASESSPGTATLDAPLKHWADIRHERALTVIRMVKTIISAASYKDEITWHYGLIPINWVRVRNFILWLGDVTGRKSTAAWRLSGLLNP